MTRKPQDLNAAIATYSTSANTYNTRSPPINEAGGARHRPEHDQQRQPDRSLDNATLGLQTANEKLPTPRSRRPPRISTAETTLNGAKSSRLTAQEKLNDTSVRTGRDSAAAVRR